MKAATIYPKQWEEVQDYVRQMKRPEHYTLLLLLIRKLGLRPIELARMETSWLVGEDLRIPHGQSKRKRPRTLPLDTELLEAFAAHLGDRRGVVFLNRQGQPFTPGLLSESVRRLFRLSVGYGSAYSGRRAASQRMLDRGENILTIQAFLGHSSPLTTLAYVGVSDQELRRAVYA